MLFAALYLLISFVLIAGAAFFFAKALGTLRGNGEASTLRLSATDRFLAQTSREEIVARLERQFHSSPSSPDL
ncbi:MAG: hypothetical protein ACUVSQ_08590 [Pseudanabaenaceae cyanobacterium]